MLNTVRRRLAATLGLALAAGLAGCNELIRSRLQAELDKFWSDPAKNAQAEADATKKLRAELEKNLVGKELEVPGPNPYVHSIKSLSLDLGTKSPVIAIPGTPTVTTTATSYYLNFEWKADWAKGNGARVDMGLDLRSHSIFLFNGYPDHDVHLRDLDAHAEGTALVIIPKTLGQSTASITVTKATLDLHADAAGWFWTVDVSKEVKKQINDNVVRDLIKKAISVTFNAKL